MNRLSLKIAQKYIFARKSHSAVNLISIVAVCGVIVTTAAIVCVMSVFNGFSALVESKLAVLDPAIKITATSGKVIGNPDSVINILSHIKGIDLAIPTIKDNALVMYGEKQMPIIVKGVPEKYDSLTQISKIVKDDGTYMLHDDVCNYAVISIGTAINLQARPGYMAALRIFAPRRKGRINIANPVGAFRSDTLFVSGVFQVDQTEYDNNTIIVPINVARNLFDYTKEASAIEISLKPGYSADQTIPLISSVLGAKYSVKDRLMQQEASFKLINIEKWVTFLLLGFIMIIATFNVISTISVLIVEKKGDIDTIRNLGASKQLLTSIFTSQSWLITIMGAFIGIIIGVALCLVQEHFGIIKLAGDPSTLIIDSYPVVVKAADIAIVILLTGFISTLSSLAIKQIMRSRLKNAL